MTRSKSGRAQRKETVKGLIEGTNLVDTDNVLTHVEVTRHVDRIQQILAQPSNPLKDLKELRKLLPGVIDHLILLSECARYLSQNSTVEEAMNQIPESLNKRWTPAQDNVLIEMASQGYSMSSIAHNFKRTPAAISSRLSYLVGVKKISQKIAGRLIGKVNGISVDDVYVDGEIMFEPPPLLQVDSTPGRHRKEEASA